MNIDEVRWALDELTAAGCRFTIDETGSTARVVGQASNWRLTVAGRRGSYWEAKPIVGHGMPVEHAVLLHMTPMPAAAWLDFPRILGALVRADGYPGGLYPERTIPRYHIDTVAGLRMFADFVARPGLTEAVIESPCPYSGSDHEVEG